MRLISATYNGSGVQTELFCRFANNERTDAFASGALTVIDLGANGTITLMNFQIANLDDGDFAGRPI